MRRLSFPASLLIFMLQCDSRGASGRCGCRMARSCRRRDRLSKEALMETHRIGLSLNPDALGMGEDPGSILLTGNNSSTTTTADLGLPGVGRAVPTAYVNCKQSLSMLPVEIG